MSSKTKIVVLHIKEIVYTIVFLFLLIALIVLLFFMFGRKANTSDSTSATSGTASGSEPGSTSGSDSALYKPGVYTSTITLSNQTLEVEVTVDEAHINSIRFANLDESITTMYPLVEPALEDIADQIYETQSTENISYSEENPYTSMVITEAIETALAKAKE